MTPGLGSKAIAGLAWGSGATAVQACAQLLSLGLFARVFTPEDLGVVAVAMVIAGAAAMIGQAGLPQAVVQKPDLLDEELGSAFVVLTASGVAAAALVWMLAHTAEEAFGMPGLARLLPIIAAGVMVKCASAPAEAVLQRTLRFATLARIEVASYFAGFWLVGGTIAILSGDVIALAAGYAVQALVKACAVVRAARGSLSPLPVVLTPVRRLMRFGMGQAFAQTSNFAATELDNAIVGVTLGPAAAGVYAKAYQMVIAPANALGMVIDKVAFPTLARVQMNTGLVRRAYLSASAAVALAFFPMGALLVLVADDLTRIVLGAGWSGAVVPLQILAIGLFARTSFQLSDSVCRSLGAVYSSSARQAAYAAAVVLGAAIGSQAGVAGVAAGVLGAMLLKYLLMTHLALRLTGGSLREYAGAIRPGIVQGIGVCAAGLACRIAVPAGDGTWSGAVLHVSMVLGASGAVVALLGWWQAWTDETVRGLFGQAWSGGGRSRPAVMEIG